MLKLPRILIAITSLALSSCIDLYYHGADSEFEYYSDINHGLQYFVENPIEVKITVWVGEFPHYQIFEVYGFQTNIISEIEYLRNLSYRPYEPTDSDKMIITDMRFMVKSPIVISFSFNPNLSSVKYHRTTNHNMEINFNYVDYYAIDPDEGKRLKDAVWDIAVKPEESSSESDPDAEETADSSSAESIEETSADDAGDPQ